MTKEDFELAKDLARDALSTRPFTSGAVELDRALAYVAHMRLMQSLLSRDESLIARGKGGDAT